MLLKKIVKKIFKMLGYKILKIQLSPLKILNFETHLVEHCNIACKYCAHFSPLAKKEFLKLECFENDCKQIAKLTGGEVSEIRLLGGEPLLHPQVAEFPRVCRKHFPGAKIKLWTNGILLLNQTAEFWDGLRESNIIIEISLYPINIDIEKIKNIGMQKGVQIDIADKNNDPKNNMFKVAVDPKGRQNYKDSFFDCIFPRNFVCITLRAGKLFVCPVIAHIRFFNEYFGKELNVTDKDYIDIYNVKNIDEIFDFLCKPKPFCRYCNMSQWKWNLPWSHSKKEICEWT